MQRLLAQRQPTSGPNFRVLNILMLVSFASLSCSCCTHSSTPAPLPGAPHAAMLLLILECAAVRRGSWSS